MYEISFKNIRSIIIAQILTFMCKKSIIITVNICSCSDRAKNCAGLKGRRELKKERKKRLRIYIVTGALAILLIAVVAVSGIVRSRTNRVSTAEGIDLIKKAEAADVSAIETKIENLENKEKQETDNGDTRSLKEQFASTVVMGDSIAAGLAEYDVLNVSSVIADIGATVSEPDDHIARLKELNPQMVFMSYGINDITEKKLDVESFTEAYETAIGKIQEELPDTKIFVNSIFPVQQSTEADTETGTDTETESDTGSVDDYNTALRELCDKLQIAFVDCTSLVSESDYEADGIHLKADFYPVWAQHMADVAEL